MYEVKTSSYKEFAGSTAGEVGYGPEVVSTQIADYFSSQGQRLGLAISEPLGGYQSTVIMPQTHDYRNEPLSIRRAEIMAHHLKSRVVLTEMPGTIGLIYPDSEDLRGYGVYTSHQHLDGALQTPLQLARAAKGDFSDHARVQLDAVSAALSLTSSDRLVLFGESMGAALTTDMVKHIGERGLHLSALVFHEVVNASGDHGLARLFSLLGGLGGAESERRDEYFAENEAIGHPIRAFEQGSTEQKRLDSARKRLSQQGVASLANGLGMRKGINNRLVNNLSRFGSRQPAVALIRGSESIVSHRNEYEALSEQLRSELPRLDRIRSWELNDLDSQPVGHFFLMSLGRQAMYARELRQFVEATVS